MMYLLIYVISMFIALFMLLYAFRGHSMDTTDTIIATIVILFPIVNTVLIIAITTLNIYEYFKYKDN